MTAGPSLALCLEQTLGHRAHGLNLEAVASTQPNAAVVRVEYPRSNPAKLPWAVRGSLAAARAVRRLPRRPDVTLFHTSTISLAAAQAATGRYVISLDATPLQVDGMGRWYRHRTAPAPVENAKRRLYGRVFRGAAAVVAWSPWAAASLASDYGVAGERIRVLHPGAPPAMFSIPRSAPRRRPTILFVGGDFDRKGGDVLLKAFAPLARRSNLVLVTDASVAPAEGVYLQPGVRPGTQKLVDLFAAADIFCLPTRGDCTSVAIEEAMAAGLPVVTTPVGSNAGTVSNGVTGRLVPPGDVRSLHLALQGLVDDAELRLRMGLAAREVAQREMDASANAQAILALLEEVA